MKVNFVCVNVGPRYGVEYVAILRDMILRNCSTMEREQAFFCITDRPDELPESVYPIPAPQGLPGWWAKVALFSPEMPWEPGDRCVYFDLDVAITGRLEDLIETKGIIQDWHWPMRNSSVMVWDHGEHADIWRLFSPEIIDRASPPHIAALLPKGQLNGGDQEHITHCAPDWPTFPADWFRSYRDAKAWPPNGCKAVIFHGSPKPSEVTEGWVPNVWKIGGFTSIPELKGANTTEDQRFENVKVNAQRDLPWFTGFPDQGKTCVIVGGAPSMKTKLRSIAKKQRQGARIVTVNNAWRTLVAAGITPDVHVMLDARPENVEFVKGAPKSMRFLIASHCDPGLLDALEGYEVSVWHNASDAGSQRLWDHLEPWRNTKPIILVPGGCTVGLRCLWLAAFSGFRTIHCYGLDSSYADDGSHHAYPQALNDGEQVLEVARGEKRYRCARWMVRQASEFQETWCDLRNYRDHEGKPAPVAIYVHGKGLLPDIARDLQAEQREMAA